MRLRHLRLGALALVALAGLIGCGGRGKLVKVEGKVTLNGAPVKGAQVTLIPVSGEGEKPSGFTGDDGTFRLSTFSSNDGAPPGDYKVIVVKKAVQEGGPEMKEGMVMDQIGMMKKAQQGQGGGKPKVESDLPLSYADPEKTPLKQRVPPDGKMVIELNDKGT